MVTALLAVSLSFAGAVRAQPGADSVTIQAGARYEAGGLHRLVFGEGYRELWTTPIQVPVLDPGSFAGGLEVLQRGEGLQTASLRFAGRDGRQYVFRSVDKNQDGGLHPDLRNTLVSRIAQDQVSSKHPAAAVVVAPLLEVAGVLHATPRLMVLADHPALGEHRAEFAGMLGIMEERPEDVEDGGAGFAGHDRIIGSERLLERFLESAEDRVDAVAYLRARLMDLLVGDWDRHPDQWRWAEDERNDRRIWLPIPRDRDNSFNDVGGLVATVGGALRPTVVSFDAAYPELYAYLHNAQPLDRRILPELEWEDWLMVSTDISARITDEVIDGAVRRLPAEYQSLDAAGLAAKLKARRDALPAVARAMYEALATEVDVHATDVTDFAILEHTPDGALTVRLREKGSGGHTYFERFLNPAETREVRIHLHAGDDTARVSGTGTGRIMVRVVGGAGDDVLVDPLTVERAGQTIFFDAEGRNVVLAGREIQQESRAHDAPESEGLAENNAPPPRDWGRSSSSFSPTADWVSMAGPVIGGGPSWTRYGFRRAPYATKTGIDFLYAPYVTRFGIEASRRALLTGGGGEARMAARATTISVTRFHGFGNESPEGPSSDLTKVWATELSGEVELERRIAPGLTLFAGPRVEYLDPAPREGGPAFVLDAAGAESFGLAGLRGEGELDLRDSQSFPRRGTRLEVEAEGYPVTWGDAEEAFVRAGGTASFYLPVPLPLESTVALRVGGERVWGDAPLQHSAFLGGGSSLRGYKSERFAGDTSLFTGAELRVLLGRANLLVARGDLGVIGYADAGRVWWRDETSREWHTGFGGGFWFAPFERSLTGHLVYGYGERHTLTAGLGMPF